jgi:uncharacterized protein YkwD
MSRLRFLPATTLTILLAGSLGPLLAPAAASPWADVALTSKHRAHAVRQAHRGQRARRQPRHRTRGYRGESPAAVPKPSAHGTVAAGRFAALAAVLATPCQNTELMPSAANLELIRASVLCLINKERAQNGETPLALSLQLGQAAEAHDREMISDDYFEHVSPAGVTPVDRIRSTGFIPAGNVGYVIGENLAWGTLGLATPQAIANAWIASPGHLANILEAQYTETGIGVVAQVPPSLSGGAAGATYTQEFGVIIH